MTKTVDIIKAIRETVKSKTNADMYLFGSTLRNLLLTDQLPPTLDVVVCDHSDTARQISYPGANFIFSIDVDYSHEHYTMDNIYACIPLDFNGNLEVQSSNNGLVDFNKKIVKLTKAGKQTVLENPSFILDTILLTAENKLTLDSTTTHLFLKNKSIVKNASPKTIYTFFRNIVNYSHPRKIISLVNAIGISQELFDSTLFETAVVNHLRMADYYEFFAIIFSNIEESKFKISLLKNGFSPKDIQIIKNIIECISNIHTEDIEAARNLIKNVNGFRVPNLVKLLNAMGFKTLSANVKSQKECVFSIDQLCISEDIIRSTFKIDDEYQIKALLEKALTKVISDPEYNQPYKILSYLNQERI